jgi:hypothetical protein
LTAPIKNLVRWQIVSTGGMAFGHFNLTAHWLGQSHLQEPQKHYPPAKQGYCLRPLP